MAFSTNTSGQLIDFGAIGGTGYSSGYGINAFGQVAGMSTTDVNDDTHAFVTNLSGQMVDLFPSSATPSFGSSINASGQVARWFDTANGTHQAFITSSNGQIVDLGSFSGGSNSYAFGINDFGLVIGWAHSANGNQHAFVTDNGIMKDINTLLVASATDWELTIAAGINDAGQITGYGVHNGLRQAYVLDAGFCCVGAFGHFIVWQRFKLIGVYPCRRKNST